MNALEIEGLQIVIEESVPMDIHSPFFDRETVVLSDGTRVNPQGNNTASFTKVSAGELANVVGHIDKFQLVNQPREISGVKLISDGQVIDTGNLRISNIRKNLNSRRTEYSFQFFSGAFDDFMKSVEGKKLMDLAMNGTVNIPGGNVSSWGRKMNGTQIGGPLDLQVADGPLPIPMDIVYEDVFDVLSFPGVSPNACRATAKYAEDVVNNGHSYFCFPKLVCYQDEEERVINNWSATQQKFITYDRETKYCLDNDEEEDTNAPYSRYTARDNPLVPMYYYHQVLKHVFSESGYELQDDWLLHDTQFLKMALVNTHSIVKPMMVFMKGIHGYMNTEDYTLYYEMSTTIEAKNHLPDMEIIEFLKDFMIKFNCYLDVSGTKVYIRHNELDTAQREIEVIGDTVEIIPEDKSGLLLEYDLDSNDSYSKEKDFTARLEDIEDSSLLPDVSGYYYLNAEFNKIHAKSDDSEVCNNLVRYHAGDAKTYRMILTPVNHKPFLYRLGGRKLLPYIHGKITDRTPLYHNYIFDAEDIQTPGSPIPTSYLIKHEYTLEETVVAEEIAGERVNIVGFYHGLLSTMESYTSSHPYPYMSHHNYQPGNPSPKIGGWNLGIIGPEGLIKTFWGRFTTIFKINRVFNISARESFRVIKAHKWNQSVIIRGKAFYVASIKPVFPLRTYPIYRCYELGD